MLMDLFRRCVPDQAVRRKILIDNAVQTLRLLRAENCERITSGWFRRDSWAVEPPSNWPSR